MQDTKDLINHIISAIGWANIWLFLIFLNSCNISSSSKQDEILEELQKQNQLLQQCVVKQEVKNEILNP